MSESLQNLIRDWSGQAVVTKYDEPTGTWIFICLHNAALGPCTGGTRIAVYPRPEDGLVDAMRLAEGMTLKWAAIGQSFGGGKAVLAVERPPEGEERTGLLERYGTLVQSLRGSFLTGEDMGTSPEDFEVIARSTRFVQGTDPRDGSKIDPSPFTARGVYAGLVAALAQEFGEKDPRGRSVLIQGVGNVGMRLGEQLREAGVSVLVSDVNRERLRDAADKLEATAVAPEDLLSTPCDVFAPCAVGAVLNEESIPRLGCRIVAGSANNQLAVAEDAERLRERGILYVPDYIINAGGALSFALLGQGLTDEESLMARMDGIGETVGEVLSEAADRGESPVEAALRRVERKLAATATSP